MKILKTCLLLALATSGNAFAAGKNWGLSLGYHNPVGANIGVNLLYMAKNFAFEFGVGGLGGQSDSNSTSSAIWGDLDVKYLFGQKWRPYVEAGFATGAAAGTSGFSLSAGGPFAGGGIMYQGAMIYCYGAADYKFTAKDIVPVAGLGFMF